MFHSREAWRGFLVLIAGFLLLFFSGLYVFIVFVDVGHFHDSPEQISKEIDRSIRLAKAVPIQNLPYHLRQLEDQSLKVSLSDKPLPDSRVMYTVDPTILLTIVHEDYSRLKISVPLEDNQWLNIERKTLPSPWFSAGLLSSVLVGLLALVLLCYFVIKRLSVPYSEFAQAAKRFSMDIQAPPLPVMGTAEMQEATKAFNDMQRHIRRMVHDRTQMLAAVSHDLRTPITRLQLRMEHFKDSVHYEKAINDLCIMEEMISSILLFARDHARTEPMEKFDLSALISSTCDDMVDMGRKVNFKTKVDRLPYYGRLNSIRRAITNFIDNAIKYGQVATVSLVIKDHGIQIKIEDQGPGIPEDLLEKVFDPFYRVDVARSPQKAGAGLGMTVARDIIRNHGGDVLLMNRKQGGLVVTITLPQNVSV